MNTKTTLSLLIIIGLGAIFFYQENRIASLEAKLGEQGIAPTAAPSATKPDDIKPTLRGVLSRQNQVQALQASLDAMESRLLKLESAQANQMAQPSNNFPQEEGSPPDIAAANLVDLLEEEPEDDRPALKKLRQLIRTEQDNAQQEIHIKKLLCLLCCRFC